MNEFLRGLKGGWVNTKVDTWALTVLKVTILAAALVYVLWIK